MENDSFEFFIKTNLVTYAPVIFFCALLGGVVLHMYFPTPFIAPQLGWGIGGITLLLAPVLIIKAMRTRRMLYIPVIERTCTNFQVGPYRYSRHPVYGGMLLLHIGFAFFVNSLAMIFTAGALFLFFTWIIIPEEEQQMMKHCSDVYRDYQKKVRMWL